MIVWGRKGDGVSEQAGHGLVRYLFAHKVGPWHSAVLSPEVDVTYGPDVIVHRSGRFLIHFFVEGLAAEEGEVALSVQRPVQGDACAGFDLGGCRFDEGVG